MSTQALPQPDVNGGLMIAVGPQLPLRIDAPIPPAFRTRVGDAADENRALVTVLTIGNPKQVSQAILRTVTGTDGNPKQVGDLMIPMPSTDADIAAFVQAQYDGHARSVQHTQVGVPYKSWEFEYPKLISPATATAPAKWECANVSEHNLNDPFSHKFLTSSGSGSGLSFEQYLLTATDLDSEIPHPLLITLPPRFFGLYDPKNAPGVNDAYCTGFATMPLEAKKAEGAQTGSAAWGTGVTIYLTRTAVSVAQMAKFSPQAQRIVRCLMIYGAQVNDRDAATRKPEVVAITGETTLPLTVCQEINNAGLTLDNFFVGKIPARYNWRTKPSQYPVLG